MTDFLTSVVYASSSSCCQPLEAFSAWFEQQLAASSREDSASYKFLTHMHSFCMNYNNNGDDVMMKQSASNNSSIIILSPLSWAVMHSHMDILSYLKHRLDHGSLARLLEEKVGAREPATLAYVAAMYAQLPALQFVIEHCESGAVMLERVGKEEGKFTPAYAATSVGSLPTLKYILEHAPSGALHVLSQFVECRRSLAWVACAKGHAEVLDYLLDKAAAVAATAAGGKSEDSLALLDLLLFAPSTAGMTPSHVAATHGHLEALKVLTSHAARHGRGVDRLLEAESLTTTNVKISMPPAFSACQHGHLHILKYICENAPSGAASVLRFKRRDGLTLVHLLCREVVDASSAHSSPPSLDILDYIVRTGGCVDYLDAVHEVNHVGFRRPGVTPAWWAAASGQVDLLEYIVKHSASGARALKFVSPSTGDSLAFVAAQNGHLDVLVYLAKHESAKLLEQANYEGETPAQAAIYAHSPATLRTILEHCASGGAALVQQHCMRDHTPATLCAHLGDTSMLECVMSAVPVNQSAALLESPVGLLERNAFWYAADKQLTHTVARMLLYCGSARGLNVPDIYGQTPRSLLTASDLENVERELLYEEVRLTTESAADMLHESCTGCSGSNVDVDASQLLVVAATSIVAQQTELFVIYSRCDL